MGGFNLLSLSLLEVRESARVVEVSRGKGVVGALAEAEEP